VHGPQTEKMNWGTTVLVVPALEVVCKMVWRPTGGQYSVELYTREFHGYRGSFIPTPTNRSLASSCSDTRDVEVFLKKTAITSHQNLAFLLGFGGYVVSVFFKDASTS